MAVHRVDPRRRSPATLEYLKERKLPSDFPLTPHRGSGQWRTKIHGRTVNFGKLDDPKAALELYRREIHARANNLPIPGEGDITLGEVVEQWVDYQIERRDAGQIANRTYEDYAHVADLVIQHFGKGAAVSSLRPRAWEGFHAKLHANTTSPTVLTRDVTVTRMIFRWAFDSDRLPDQVRFGPAFKVAPKKEVRRKRLESKKRTLDAKDIRKLIDVASQPLQTMILLGANCGMTQAEVSALEWRDIDLDKAVVDTLRSKTVVERVATLWPETVASLREISRQGDIARVFSTRFGNPFVYNKINARGALIRRDNIATEFSKLAKRAGVKLPARVGFGKLRHTFRTVADNVRDANAIRRIMGHEIGRDSIEATYTDTIELDRIRAVTDHVRNWLYPETKGK
ncbi:MAG: site-specific integrase [Phycisphaeraceae bacterium]|nr:site-specific integrase [Phycisphaeraceae bacterium]